MKVVSKEQDYESIMASVDRVLNIRKKLPENVFVKNLKYFLFITFDDLFMPLFFDHVKQFLENFADNNFWVAVIDPDPKLYYRSNFDFFGAFKFSNLDTEDDYISALNDYPKNSPADALAHNSNLLVVSSLTNEWVIYGDRDADIAICAFADRIKMELFREIYGTDLLDGVKVAAMYAYGATEQGMLFEEFCKNYSHN